MKLLTIIGATAISLQPAVITTNFMYEKTEEARIITVSSLFENENIGKITNPDKSVIFNYLRRNFQNIDWNFLDIDQITYKDFRVFANNQPNNRYVGQVYLRYDAEVKTNFQWSSKEIGVRRYSGSETQRANATARISTPLGMRNFTDVFDSAKITWKAFTYNNHDEYRYYNADLIDINGVSDESDIKKFKYSTTTYRIPNNFQSSNRFVTIERTYKRVNQMTASGGISIWWEKSGNIDTLAINFNIEVFAYSSAWNAFWAESKAQFHIDSIKF